MLADDTPPWLDDLMEGTKFDITALRDSLGTRPRRKAAAKLN